MLVLKRKEKQWTEIIHRSGDVLRIRLCDVGDGRANLIFDDTQRNFEIERPERRHTQNGPVTHDDPHSRTA